MVLAQTIKAQNGKILRTNLSGGEPYSHEKIFGAKKEKKVFRPPPIRFGQVTLNMTFSA